MIPFLLTLYFAAKVIDLVNRDAWPLLFEFNAAGGDVLDRDGRRA